MQDNYKQDINKIKRDIVILKREIRQLKFKNSPLFKILHIINAFIFVTYLQFILAYLFEFNSETIKNSHIQFKTNFTNSQNIKLYTIIINYKNYSFRSKINKQFDKSILYSDVRISKDLFFHLPQKLKLMQFNQQWFVIYESMGIFTICAIILFTQTIAYIYKQNEHYYPLLIIFILNMFSFLSISIFSMYVHSVI